MTMEHRPYTLIAELTYRCPLRCPYCSNPVGLGHREDEIDGHTWVRVLEEAERLGVVQVNLTGGEPLLRQDLERLIERAGQLDLYTNLITSGIPLTRARLAALQRLGLNGVQISIQSARPEESDHVAGAESFNQKLEAMGWAKELGLPLTVNVVLHRDNIGNVTECIALAEHVSADRIELANAQYHGWAWRNRTSLLPTKEQLEQARNEAQQARSRLRGTMEVQFVMPDYYSDIPKSCLNGWGRNSIVVNPEGLVLPCHLAHMLPGLSFDNVKLRNLHDIWHHSSGFNRYRGEDWMPDPCRGCDRRLIDFGGCRCQAFQIAGDAGLTDPACSLSPHHPQIVSARAQADSLGGVPVQFEYRSARGISHA
ncbi:Coenzyme PQQ synthesis protein E [Nitrospira sp. KM1]|uniref:pyrroloquinoline quinone biosynthesis protein PqqE n=1 Tax=Nitrospira sp. KM1 TaxID=1936990 RepID=UPI0013A725F1|nr:pyrroloquinoline quinone biosynthesis protein PqqE [Nitrospira sp. KM1]BCA55256.1 Coenzyme PQQ synthesis protein E [Nitrospira sp. KM1]